MLELYVVIWYGYMNISKIFTLIFTALILFISAPSFAQQSEQNNEEDFGVILLDARISATQERARLVLDLSEKIQFALVSFDNPLRIGVDIRSAKNEFSKQINPPPNSLISSISFEKAKDGRLRTWLYLSDYAQVQQAYILDEFEDQPARLVVDIILTGKEIFMANVAKNFNLHQQNSAKDEAFRPKENSSDFTPKLASRPLIIIDPGHGGKDSGATSNHGDKEKDIVLDFALILQKTLTETGNFDVALTRTDDSFVSLEDRIFLARKNKADLFISIHADSFAQKNIGGMAIYTIDEEMDNDTLDKVLTKNETKLTLISALVPANISDNGVDLLVDLLRRNTRKHAFILANKIVDQLKPSIRLRRFPLRRGDFFVLQSPEIPSILVELGFLSNMEDIENLATKEWKKRVADSIMRAVVAYFDEKERQK